MGAHSSATNKVLAWLGGIDLVITSIVLFYWLVVVQVADPRVMIPLTLVRMVLLGLTFVRMLGPVRATLIRDEDADDALLIRADRTLQDIDGRMMTIYGSAWLATTGLSLALAVMGIPSELPLGHAELATAIIMAVSLSTVALPIRALVHAMLFEPHQHIARQIMTRGLGVNRPPRSVGNLMRAIILGLITSTVPGMMMSSAYMQIVGVRANTTLEALREAEHAAVAFERSRSSGPAGAATLTAASKLPSRLQDKLTPGVTELRAYDPAAQLALAAVPVADGRWLLVQTKVDEQLGAALILVVLVTGCSLTLAWWISNALWRPLARLFNELDVVTRRSVEVGDISALVRMVPLHDDELGRLATNFNRMLDMLDELTAAAGAVANGQLDVELGRPGELHDAFRGMLEQLNRVVPQIRSTAVELAGAASEIQAAMRAQDDLGAQQSDRMIALGEAVGALSSAASDIAQEAARVLADAEQASEATRASADELVHLHDRTGAIVGLLAGIHEIADRSDLLALNGSLEATRAGEAGRGFSLVADEMRRLAERITGLVVDMRGRISDIERANQSTMEVTERSRGLAHSTAGAARRIAGLIEEQNHATEDVAATVDGVASAVDAVAQASVQTRATAEGLERQATQLEQLTRSFDMGHA